MFARARETPGLTSDRFSNYSNPAIASFLLTGLNSVRINGRCETSFIPARMHLKRHLLDTLSLPAASRGDLHLPLDYGIPPSSPFLGPPPPPILSSRFGEEVTDRFLRYERAIAPDSFVRPFR